MKRSRKAIKAFSCLLLLNLNRRNDGICANVRKSFLTSNISHLTSSSGRIFRQRRGVGGVEFLGVYSYVWRSIMERGKRAMTSQRRGAAIRGKIARSKRQEVWVLKSVRKAVKSIFLLLNLNRRNDGICANVRKSFLTSNISHLTSSSGRIFCQQRGVGGVEFLGVYSYVWRSIMERGKRDIATT